MSDNNTPHVQGNSEIAHSSLRFLTEDNENYSEAEVAREGRQAITELDLAEEEVRHTIMRESVLLNQGHPTHEEEHAHAKFKSEQEENEAALHANQEFDEQWEIDSDGHFHQRHESPRHNQDFDEDMEDGLAAVAREGRQAIMELDLAEEEVRDTIMRESALRRGLRNLSLRALRKSTSRVKPEAQQPPGADRWTARDELVADAEASGSGAEEFADAFDRLDTADDGAATLEAGSLRGAARSGADSSNVAKLETAPKASPILENRSQSKREFSGAIGTYRNRRNERERLGIPPAGAFEAEHILPFQALHPDVKRRSSRARALEKKMPAYLEVKELHRRHPATGDTGKNRVACGWPTGDGCRADMRTMLSDPVAEFEGRTLSNIYQMNQLGYAHVLAELDRQSVSVDPLDMALATDSYNHTVNHNPRLELPNVAPVNSMLKLDPEGQALAVLAREVAMKGEWPKRERIREVYHHFLDQDFAEKTAQAPTSVSKKTDRLNSTGDQNEATEYRSPSKAARERGYDERERSISR